MRRMARKCGFLFPLSLAVLITACASGTSLHDDAEKKRILENVETVLRSEHDLLHFHITYAQYDEAIHDIASGEYRAALRDEIVFGYNDESYTREDMAGMTVEEYERHKEFMLRMMRHVGLDKVRTVVKISDVYEGDRPDQAVVYALESKTLQDRPMTTTTLKYSLEKRDGQWLVTNVERDKLTHGPDDTAEEIEDGIKGLQYQRHGGEAVRYSTVIELAGAEE